MPRVADTQGILAAHPEPKTMYLPEHFAERGVEELHRFMSDFPFATIVTHTAQGLVLKAAVQPHGPCSHL